MASFAMLGDIILGEPRALAGFAGPRVIKQTIGQTLPDGFQRTEFLLEHGFIDMVVERKEMKEKLYQLLFYHNTRHRAVKHEKEPLHFRQYKKKEKRKQGRTDAWERVKRSRMQGRPTAMDYISLLFQNFLELHGDRISGDDKAVIGGIASIGGVSVTVIAQQKGRNTKENIERNFAMPNPEGYRKALRLMRQAEKFHRPVICFVDTPGAFCGIQAEERGQGEAIARNLYEMSSLKVPVLTLLIGEGGSGGALALAVANEVWMLENAIYSILSPEGFASILWKDSKKAPNAAEVMKITATDLYEKGLIEQVIPEEEPASEDNLQVLAGIMQKKMKEFLIKYEAMAPDEIAGQRYQRFRNI